MFLTTLLFAYVDQLKTSSTVLRLSKFQHKNFWIKKHQQNTRKPIEEYLAIMSCYLHFNTICVKVEFLWPRVTLAIVFSAREPSHLIRREEKKPKSYAKHPNENKSDNNQTEQWVEANIFKNLTTLELALIDKGKESQTL